MTEFELFQALRPQYPAREYALLPQVANATGFSANRHCDALALSLWPSRGMHLSGFEIKSYRGDWIRELRDPEKAEGIAKYCNYWWVVAGGPFITADDVPQLWGLMIWDEEKKLLSKLKRAPYRKAIKPDLPFLAAALRKAQEVATPTAALDEALANGLKKGREESAQTHTYDLRQYELLKEQVRDFEKASGIQISASWPPGKDIGEAVKQILNGTVMHERASLLRLASRIIQELEDADSDNVPANAHKKQRGSNSSNSVMTSTRETDKSKLTKGEQQ